MKIYVNKENYNWQTRAVNGEDKMYIDIQFRKEQEPQQPFCQIEIKDGFFSMYKTKQGLAKPKLVILNYEVISQTEYELQERQAIMNENEYEITDSSYDSSILPF